MSQSCNTTEPLAFSSERYPIDLSAELDNQIQIILHPLGQSSSIDQTVVTSTPLQNRFIRLSHSGLVKIDCLPAIEPKKEPEEKLREFAERYPHFSSAFPSKASNRPHYHQSLSNGLEKQLFHAWVAALLTQAPQAYEIIDNMVKTLPKNCSLNEKLFHSLLLLGNFDKNACQRVAISLIMNGLDVDACHKDLGTPLHVACTFGLVDVARKILAMISDASKLNEKDKEGFTAAARLAQYRENHGDSKEIRELVISFAKRQQKDKDRHLNPNVWFNQWIDSQGYITDSHPPSLPVVYKDYYALLLNEHYQMKERPKHRKNASSGTLSSLRRQLSSSKKNFGNETPLTTAKENGEETIEEKITYLKKRFYWDYPPSSQRIYDVIYPFITNGKWKLVDEVLALVHDHLTPHYENLLLRIKQDVITTPTPTMASLKRQKSIESMLGMIKKTPAHSLIL